ncbi:MAG: N-acetylmuramoyl-L-alanine amidase [Aestuariivirga sp.]|uniref:N-acetylmuramoyl-L-alanine amidase n=1 Tax=Aestuariivirga sp. TaxID=2650926 RepID=UPI0038CFE86A
MMFEPVRSRFAAARRVLGRLGLAAVMLAGGAAMAAAESPVATAARITGDAGHTRFEADVSATVGFSVYALAEPYRVVIDLPQVAFDLPPGTGDSGQGLIRAFRYGPVGEGRARIVLDTEGPALIERASIGFPEPGKPARLTVDLVKTGADAFAAKLASVPPETDEPPAAAPRRDGRKLVVIDPGHGGIDPGAIGVRKTREKDVVLGFGLKLRDLLQARGNVDVMMTRSDDRFLSLKERVRIARDNEADLFIAIHADTVRGPAARGATIYTLSEKASDAEAEALAHKENRADIIAGIDLETESEEVTDILIELAQRESKAHSLVFARKAVAEMKTVTRFTGKPMRSAGFVVLKAPDVPSVLLELGYLSSRQDEEQLTSPAWQEKTATALARAIETYFAQQLAARAP